MTNIANLLTEHMAIWTAADTEKKTGRGRASGNAGSVYGVKKLRELILELAVRGKLVPQDPNDEPASELIKRVQAEKAKLIAEGKLKKEKPLAPIGDDEKPFELPNKWQWVRVDEVGHDWGQKTPNQEFTYIEVSAIDNHRGLVVSPDIVQPEDAPSRARKVVKQNTIIYSTVRPYLLNIAVIDAEFEPEAIASTAFAIIHPYCEMPSRYFLYYLRSPIFIQYVESVQTGIAYPAINDGQFYSGLLALPPLAEQHRIVAKVDELMALCDQLEQQHSNAQEAHATLVSQLLATLTQSQNAAEFNTNWQRIYAHFDVLFTTEASIDALKQTLLQLAVMGKLVPQDPNDEPAGELLKRIKAEKTKLIAEGKLKKEKPLAPIGEEDEKPFELPKGWEWVMFGELISLINGDRSKNYPNQSEYVKNGVPWINTGHIEPDGTLTTSEMNYITQNKYDELRSGKIEENDLVYCLRGATFGKTAFVKPYTTGAIASSLVIIRPHSKKLAYYIYKYLISPFGKSQVYRFDNGSAQPNLSANSVTLYSFPLPPLAEQQRIVAKLDALMALCDQLKTRIQQANQQQQAIADALVAQAVA
jgi:type I restriction enzyme, S subunit